MFAFCADFKSSHIVSNLADHVSASNEIYLSIRQVFPDHLDYPAGTSFVSRFKTGFFGIISNQHET